MASVVSRKARVVAPAVYNSAHESPLPARYRFCGAHVARAGSICRVRGFRSKPFFLRNHVSQKLSGGIHISEPSEGNGFVLAKIVCSFQSMRQETLQGTDIIPENFQNLQTIEALLRQCGVVAAPK